MYKKIKRWYTMGLWNEKMVLNAVKKGVLTESQANEIQTAIDAKNNPPKEELDYRIYNEK